MDKNILSGPEHLQNLSLWPLEFAKNILNKLPFIFVFVH